MLIDSEPIFLEVARAVLARRGRTLTHDMVQAMMGSPARQVFAIFRRQHGLSETVDELIVESTDLFFTIWETRPAPLLPGVLSLLDRLEQAGVPKALATSSSRRYVERVLTPYQLLPRFQFVLTSDDVTLGKPHPEIYQRAAGRLGCQPLEMLVLEDSINGLRAAKAAGAKCIVVPHALVLQDELRDADAVLDSLESPVLHRLLGLAG